MGKFVPVLPGEGGKVLHFAVFAGLLQAGVAIGIAAADSLFLSHLGADRLPGVYLCMPVVMAAYAPAYSFLLSRLGIERLVRLTVAALVAGAVALGVAYGAAGEDRAWLLYAGKFYAGMWFIGLYTLFWNFTDAYFSIQDGKRLYGLIAAGGSLGGLLGAGLVALLAERVGAANLYYGWAAVALLTFPVFGRLRRRYRTVEIESHEPADSARPAEVLRAVFAAFARSRFALGIAVLCFAAVSLTAGLEFLSMGVLAEGRSAAGLAVTLGRLQAVAYVLTLFINVALFGRVVGWLGIANTALVLPLTYIGAFLLLHLRPGVATAVLAFYAYQTVLPGIEYNNVNLLFNAVAPRVKAMLRTFVEAMAEPLATACAGLFLLSLASRAGRENVALVGVAASCGALAVALVVRSNYVRALEANLREDWLNFGDAARDWSREFSEPDRALLREKACSSRRSEQRLAADLLCRARDRDARPVLHRLLSSAVPGEVQHLRPAIRFLIQDDGASDASTAAWLEGADGPTEPEVIDEFTVSGVVSARRIRSWNTVNAGGSRSPVPAWEPGVADSEETRAQIADLLAGSPRERVAALRALADLAQPGDAELIVRHLADGDAGVRTEALRILGKLAGNGNADLVDRALPLLAEASDEQRHLVLRLVSRRGSADSALQLLRYAEYLTASETRELETLLIERSETVVPRLLSVLRDTAAPMPARLIAVRSVSRLDMPLLVRLAPGLVDAVLVEAQHHVAEFRGLACSPAGDTEAGRVLTRFYRDAAREAVEFALQLMSRVGRLPDFELIKASLSFANPKERANAIEAIQQGCTQATFARICHLLDAMTPSPRALAAVQPQDTTAGGGRDPAEVERIATQVVLGAEAVTPRGREILDQAAGLAASTYFGEASARVLTFLARRSRRVEAAAGAVIYDLGATVEPVLYVVTDGRVEITRAAGSIMAGIGAVFGERALMLDRERTDRAVSAGATLIAVPCDAVVRAIEICPALGIQLYRFKTVSAVNYTVAPLP